MHTFPNRAGFHPEGMCGWSPVRGWKSNDELACCSPTAKGRVYWHYSGPFPPRARPFLWTPFHTQTDNRQTDQSTKLLPISPHGAVPVELLATCPDPPSLQLPPLPPRFGSPDLVIICLESFSILWPDARPCFWFKHFASLLVHYLVFPLSCDPAVVLGKQFIPCSLTLRTLHLQGGAQRRWDTRRLQGSSCWKPLSTDVPLSKHLWRVPKGRPQIELAAAESCMLVGTLEVSINAGSIWGLPLSLCIKNTGMLTIKILLLPAGGTQNIPVKTFTWELEKVG